MTKLTAIIAIIVIAAIAMTGCAARPNVVTTTPDVQAEAEEIDHNGDQVIYDDTDADGIVVVLTIRGDGPRDSRTASWDGNSYRYDR